MIKSKDLTAALPVASVLAIFILVPSILLQSWVITLLWRWYAAPLAWPSIPFSGVVGVNFVFRVLLGDRYNPNDDRSLGVYLFAAFVGPLVYLCMGWILRFVL